MKFVFAQYHTMRILFFLITVLSAAHTFAQPGYKIEFQIEGLKDTTVNLGYYLSEQTYRRDTAQVDSKGYFFFDGAKALPPGVYFLLLGNALQYQFVLGADQHFRMTTRRADYIKNMKVTGDPDNEAYFENMNYSATRYAEVEPFIKVLRDSTASKEAKAKAQEGYQKIFGEVMAHQNDFVAKNPTFVSSRWLKATKQVEVPDPPKDASGKILDSTFQFKYYRKHYFDYFDLADEALLRLPKPLYVEKVKDYLDRLFIQHPDTLYNEILKLAAVAKKNQETYKWLVWTCIGHYQTHTIMGLDEVYVRLVDKFVKTGEMDFWIDKTSKKNTMEYVDKVRLSLVGNTAPNLIFQDKDLKPRSMYDIKNKYTILFFFRPTCGHCKEETPKLVEFYKKNKKLLDVEVFAVDTDTSLVEMKKFITDMKTEWITVSSYRSYVGHFSKFYHADLTPTIYVIDDKKKIIGKKLDVSQLEDFLTRYSKAHPKI